MNEFPQVDGGARKLFDMIYAPVYTKMLFAGIELNIFSFLKEPRSHEQISEILDLDTSNTQHLLDALAAIDLLTKYQGEYQNTSITNKYLIKDSELYMGDFLTTYSSVTGFEDLDIKALVENGPIEASSNPTNMQSDDFIQMLKNSQRIGRAYDIAELVSTLPEFSNFKRMLDLGGGPGLLTMAILKKHNAMQGVVFEAQEIAQVTCETIKEYRMQNRMDVISGDFMTDAIGENYDLIFACGSLNFAKHNMDGIIRKIYDALNPKGVFVCISEGLIFEETAPKEIVAGWLPSKLAGQDFSLLQGEVSDTALRVGFQSVYKRTINTLLGTLDLDIIRK